ncbi:MAG: DNA adenine methylase, partial [Chlorobi bacterium]|nr:DNA adenine methylase [Chlorobiota bacterium]
NATEKDFIYADPPYIARHTNYYDFWTEKDEFDLYELLSKFKGRFILSTWYRNKYRENDYVNRLWKEFNIITKRHFYHIGAKESNRNFIEEALVLNFEPLERKSKESTKGKIKQKQLW